MTQKLEMHVSENEIPRVLKWTVAGAVGVICAGAAYLFATRGPAMLLDLGGAISACF